jgi:AraC-like DNA-binding protein
VIGPGEVHEIRPEGAGTWVFDTLFVDDGVMGAYARGPGVVWREAPGGIVGAFDRLHRAVVRGGPVLMQEDHLAELAGWLVEGPAPRGHVGGVGLCRVREYLDECPGGEVSLTRLAELAGLSPSHLSRSFRRAFGLPPHEYLVQARVRRSRALLGRGVAIVEAAVRVGFADQAHLTRHFRRLVGVTPGAYRRGSRIVQDLGSENP